MAAKCADCGGTDFRQYPAGTVCKSCGNLLLTEEKIESHPVKEIATLQVCTDCGEPVELEAGRYVHT